MKIKTKPLPKMKKLYRSKNDRMIAGICGGLGNYLNIDSTIIRLILIFGGIATLLVPLFLAYLIAILIIPEEERVHPIKKIKFKLYRSLKDRKIAGICGGLASITKLDSAFIRLIFIFLCIITGIVPLILIYLIGWIIIPLYPSKRDYIDLE